MNLGVAGEVRFVVTKADGSVKTDTGFQKNLILNQGLDFFGGGKGTSFNASCAIGSGNSTPNITQNGLDAYIAQQSGVETVSSFDYTDTGDGLYRMSEQKKYRFTGLSDVNISEVGLASTGSTESSYYLTTRALIKDSAGVPTTISVLSGETLDVIYKIHKVVNTGDTASVINILDGAGGAVPYNVVVRPARVGETNWKLISTDSTSFPSELGFATTDIVEFVSFPSLGKVNANVQKSTSSYVNGSFKSTITLTAGLSEGNISIRSITPFTGGATPNNYGFFNFQMRLGRVSDDAPLTKTDKDTLTIPFEISWGRYEGAL